MTYSSYLAVGRGRYASKGQNQIKFASLSEGRLGPITNGVLLIVMICILGLIYLSQVTKTNAYGYKISDLQSKNEQLVSEHNDLEVESARLQSLDRVKNSPASQQLATAAPSETLQN